MKIRDLTKTRRAFNDSKDACSLFPLEEIAREYDAPAATPEAVAQAYAEQVYRPGPMRRASYRGCLAGIKQRS